MVKRKIIKYIIIGGCVIATAIFLVVNPTKVINKEGVANRTQGNQVSMDKLAREKARIIFVEQYGEKIRKNAIIVKEYERPWMNRLFPNYTLYRVTLVLSRNIEACPSYVILVGKDKKNVFALPVDLTEILQREEINIEQKDLILDIAKIYVETKLSLVSEKDLIFLNGVNDIPWIIRPESAKDPSVYDETITPPRLYSKEKKWCAEFYTYERGGGIIRKWLFEIDKNYQFEVESIEIARKVGDFMIQTVL